MTHDGTFRSAPEFAGFTDRARKVLDMASHHAIATGGRSIKQSHVLFAVLEEGWSCGLRAIECVGVDSKHLQRTVTSTLVRGGSSPAHAKGTRSPRVPSGGSSNEHAALPLDGESVRMVARAIEEARLLKHRYVGTEHLVLALARGRGKTARLLASVGATPAALRSQVLYLLGAGD